jgi:hypothetical protein
MRTVCDSCLTALDGLAESEGASLMWQTINDENWDAWDPGTIMIQLSKRFRQYMPAHRCDLQKDCECSGYESWSPTQELLVYQDC